jgi:toxin ParE1/3/4
MREIVWLDSAVNDLVRLRAFVATHNPKAAKKVAETLKKSVSLLEKLPFSGKPVMDLPDYRDVYARFGAGGFVIRYRVTEEQVYVVHIRHYRETNFKT